MEKWSEEHHAKHFIMHCSTHHVHNSHPFDCGSNILQDFLSYTLIVNQKCVESMEWTRLDFSGFLYFQLKRLATEKFNNDKRTSCICYSKWIGKTGVHLELINANKSIADTSILFYFAEPPRKASTSGRETCDVAM